MHTSNRFNLVDEPWIPIIGVGLVSLKQIFDQPTYLEIGGNPIQKISITKLLLAIVQSACSVDDEEAWRNLGVSGMAACCLKYLENWKDSFWLYGEKPFLQMPAIKQAHTQPTHIGLPEVAINNTSLISQWQTKRELTDADKALIVLTLSGFAMGSKKTDSISLCKEYKKKAAGCPGAHLGYVGYLHNFVTGSNILYTLWLNTLTHTQIKKYGFWFKGLGTAPWERMPLSEDCEVAKELKDSYLGRLVPLSRFCLLKGDELHYSEGIVLKNHKEGGVDPAVAINRSKKDLKAAWVDPTKRPWRWISSFLSFLGPVKTDPYECVFIREGVERAKHLSGFGIWSGGLKVSANSGEQYVSGEDDFVESKLFLSSEVIGEGWFNEINQEIEHLDFLSKLTYQSVSRYYKDMKADGSGAAKIASNLFWQRCEQYAQQLLIEKEPKNLRKHFQSIVYDIYNHLCPKDTARQLDSWAKNQPNLNKVN